MKKIIICLLFVAIIVSFSACSVFKMKEIPTENEVPIVSQTNAETTSEPSTQPESETAGESSSAAEIDVTEEEAKNIAYSALKEEYPKGNTTFGIDYTQFEFESIKRCDIREQYCAFNTGYSIETYNTSSHPYYAVSYTDTTQIAGFAYFCIDLRNGDLLFSGYMGD